MNKNITRSLVCSCSWQALTTCFSLSLFHSHYSWIFFSLSDFTPILRPKSPLLRSTFRPPPLIPKLHHQVLKNGVEVKLQRNALSVLEPPTGNEEDEDDSDNSSGNSEILETNNNRFCRRFQFPRVSKPRVQYTRPWTPSLSPKPSSPHSSFKQVQSIVRTSKLRVSFAKLGSRSLGRYCRNCKIGSGNQNLTREQVISVVQQHFVSQKVDEVQVIGEFIRAAKRLKSSSDRFNA